MVIADAILQIMEVFPVPPSPPSVVMPYLGTYPGISHSGSFVVTLVAEFNSGGSFIVRAFPRSQVTECFLLSASAIILIALCRSSSVSPLSVVPLLAVSLCSSNYFSFRPHAV